jgi:RNA polymerase sporulation-specific sigma factor
MTREKCEPLCNVKFIDDNDALFFVDETKNIDTLDDHDESSADDFDKRVVKKDLKEDEDEEIPIKSFAVEDILFKLPIVSDPLDGTPKDVQGKLNKMAIYIRRNPHDHLKNDHLFDKIHLYMHGFLINMALKQFPYIKGLQTVDIYQEALIALRFKAIPGFRQGRGMSFLNFAKMCIRRHLITILNISKNRLKDKSINQAISLDQAMPDQNDSSSTYSNIIPDQKCMVDEKMANDEAYDMTLKMLYKTLSEFEQLVLKEYLSTSSYTEISDALYNRTKKRYPTKAIDNALVRIRAKAKTLKGNSRNGEIPMFD